MDFLRDEVTSPSGHRYLVQAAPDGGIDTSADQVSRSAYIGGTLQYMKLFGWLRHRVRNGGRWTVSARRLGGLEEPVVVHAESAQSMDAATQAMRTLRRKIALGEID